MGQAQTYVHFVIHINRSTILLYRNLAETTLLLLEHMCSIHIQEHRYNIHNLELLCSTRLQEHMYNIRRQGHLCRSRLLEHMYSTNHQERLLYHVYSTHLQEHIFSGHHQERHKVNDNVFFFFFRKQGT